MNNKRRVSEAAYRALSNEQRLALAMEALGRRDRYEVNVLRRTCRQATYRGMDIAFDNMLSGALAVAWQFLDDWCGLLEGWQFGVREVLDAAARILPVELLPTLAAEVEKGRRCAHQVANLHTAEGHDRAAASVLQTAWSPIRRSVSGHIELLRRLRQLAEGLKLYCSDATLTLHQALAPVPETLRNRIQDEIASLAPVAYDERAARAYADGLCAQLRLVGPDSSDEVSDMEVVLSRHAPRLQETSIDELRGWVSTFPNVSF